MQLIDWTSLGAGLVRNIVCQWKGFVFGGDIPYYGVTGLKEAGNVCKHVWAETSLIL